MLFFSQKFEFDKYDLPNLQLKNIMKLNHDIRMIGYDIKDGLRFKFHAKISQIILIFLIKILIFFFFFFNYLKNFKMKVLNDSLPLILNYSSSST